MSNKDTMTETFKEPFLEKVKEAVDGAVSVTWEGCHKIYICMDQESHEQQVEYGYDMTMVTDKDDAVRQLYEWFDVSCGLRFISAITDASQFEDVIAQFEYNEEELDGE